MTTELPMATPEAMPVESSTSTVGSEVLHLAATGLPSNVAVNCTVSATRRAVVVGLMMRPRSGWLGPAGLVDPHAIALVTATEATTRGQPNLLIRTLSIII